MKKKYFICFILCFLLSLIVFSRKVNAARILDEYLYDKSVVEGKETVTPQTNWFLKVEEINGSKSNIVAQDLWGGSLDGGVTFSEHEGGFYSTASGRTFYDQEYILKVAQPVVYKGSEIKLHIHYLMAKGSKEDAGGMCIANYYVRFADENCDENILRYAYHEPGSKFLNHEMKGLYGKVDKFEVEYATGANGGENSDTDIYLTLKPYQTGDVSMVFTVWRGDRTHIRGMQRHRMIITIKDVQEDPAEEYEKQMEDGEREKQELESQIENENAMKQPYIMVYENHNPTEIDVTDDVLITQYLMGLTYKDAEVEENLWEKFVQETTPELRDQWLQAIDDPNNNQLYMRLLRAQVYEERGEAEAAAEERAAAEAIARAEAERIAAREARMREIEEERARILEIINQLRGIDTRSSTAFDDIFDDISLFIPRNEATDTRTFNKANTIFNVITNIGIVVSVLMLLILGIKYMLGSVEDKAEYKKDMIPYLIGAMLLFGITAILKILQQVGNNINSL